MSTRSTSQATMFNWEVKTSLYLFCFVLRGTVVLVWLNTQCLFFLTETTNQSQGNSLYRQAQHESNGFVRAIHLVSDQYEQTQTKSLSHGVSQEKSLTWNWRDSFWVPCLVWNYNRGLKYWSGLISGLPHRSLQAQSKQIQGQLEWVATKMLCHQVYRPIAIIAATMCNVPPIPPSNVLQPLL